jgi:predicted RNA-binding protein
MSIVLMSAAMEDVAFLTVEQEGVVGPLDD